MSHMNSNNSKQKLGPYFLICTDNKSHQCWAQTDNTGTRGNPQQNKCGQHWIYQDTVRLGQLFMENTINK